MVCIDSDIIIDFLRKRRDAQEVLVMIETREGTLQTTAINSFEVFKGVTRHSNPEKYEEVAEFLARFSVLDLTFEASQKAAEIHEVLKSQGLLVDMGDILIAAVVIANNETLLTRNTKHFERIPGLKLEPLPGATR